MPKFGKKDVAPDLGGVIGAHAGTEGRAALAGMHSEFRNSIFGDNAERRVRITRKLLSAVAYGMESRTANVDSEAIKNRLMDLRQHHHVFTEEEQVIAGLYEKSPFYAEDLLKRSPEFLLERACDGLGRPYFQKHHCV